MKYCFYILAVLYLPLNVYSQTRPIKIVVEEKKRPPTLMESYNKGLRDAQESKIQRVQLEKEQLELNRLRAEQEARNQKEIEEFEARSSENPILDFNNGTYEEIQVWGGNKYKVLIFKPNSHRSDFQNKVTGREIVNHLRKYNGGREIKFNASINPGFTDLKQIEERYSNISKSEKLKIGIIGEQNENGFLVISLTETGGAKAAGILKGDIITKTNGQSIVDSSSISSSISNNEKGDIIEVELIRQGVNYLTDVTLDKAPGEFFGQISISGVPGHFFTFPNNYNDYGEEKVKLNVLNYCVIDNDLFVFWFSFPVEMGEKGLDAEFFHYRELMKEQLKRITIIQKK